MILCFVGPPGVGKTSLGRSIARAMDRKFIRQSLGGIRDEAEMRGFRRTYVGSMPGRIIQALRRVESKNPVFMLDEVDKIGSDWRGDPSSALLEVLDPEQNNEFRDHYLDVPFDLSQVMFICTANQLGPIPAPLRDRMEIIELDGYTEHEKVEIAKQYLVPRQIKENGLRADEVSFAEEALQRIIREYTYESGVRNLERQIGAVCRKVTTHVADGHEGELTTDRAWTTCPPTWASASTLWKRLDERAHIPGVAVGLVVTMAGGDITFVEGTKMAGNRGLTLTGQLGDVMRESAQAALSYVRSQAERTGHRGQGLCRKRDSHSRAGGRGAQRWPVCRRDHGHGAGLAAHRAPDHRAPGHDRRDHAARPGAACGRRQAKGACRCARGHRHRHPAQAQRS